MEERKKPLGFKVGRDSMTKWRGTEDGIDKNVDGNRKTPLTS